MVQQIGWPEWVTLPANQFYGSLEQMVQQIGWPEWVTLPANQFYGSLEGLLLSLLS